MTEPDNYYNSSEDIVRAYHSGGLRGNYPMLCDAIDKLLLQGPPITLPLQRFNIDEEIILAAAKRRWKNVKEVKTGAPYWIDVNYSTLRVGVEFEGSCCFGANFNYRTGEFDGPRVGQLS